MPVVGGFLDGEMLALSLNCGPGGAPLYWRVNLHDNGCIWVDAAAPDVTCYFEVTINDDMTISLYSYAANGYLSVISDQNELYLWASKPDIDEWCKFDDQWQLSLSSKLSFSNKACGNLHF